MPLISIYLLYFLLFAAFVVPEGGAVSTDQHAGFGLSWVGSVNTRRHNPGHRNILNIPPELI